VFRELGYGVLFFLSAAAGAIFGPGLLYPGPRGGSIEAQIQEDVTATILGAIGGAVGWLIFKYTYLRLPKQR